MSVAVLDAQPARAGHWTRQGGALALAAAAILLLFRRDVAALVHVWWTSTTYGHCLFVGPVIAWLAWQRRRELARLTPVGWWPGLAIVAAGGSGWLLGDAGTVAFACQLGLVMMLAGAVVTLLGSQVARGLAFPLGYSLFLVPFGDALEPPLQRATVAIVMPLLALSGVPAEVDGVLIHAGRYWFEVAEACSGAKFVIAMVAFGVLVANVCFLRWRRRAVFLAVCVVVPVIANGLRAWGTIFAADRTSLEAATGFDHIVYGWVFFGLVIAGVLAIGWRWFDRAPDDPAFDPAALPDVPRGQRLEVVPAVLLVLATAAIFPAWSGAVASRRAVLPQRMVLPDVPGWRRVPIGDAVPWRPYYPAADHYLVGRYADGRGRRVDLAVAAFASQRQGAELVSFGTGVLREEDRWVRVADLAPIDGGGAVRITAPGPVERIVATWYRLRGTTTADGTRVKIETTLARLFGGPQHAVAVHLSTEGRDPAPIAAFLAAAGPPGAIADRMTAAR